MPAKVSWPFGFLKESTDRCIGPSGKNFSRVLYKVEFGSLHRLNATRCYLFSFGHAIIIEMRKVFVSSMIAVLACPFVLPAQEPAAEAPKAAKSSPYSSLLGEVTAIGADGKQITLKTDAGASSAVTLDDKTHFMKVAPGEKDLKKATDVRFSEIGVGDRVLARVRKLEDGSASPATTVVVMTKAALAQHQDRNQAEWQTRGLVGTVSLVNPATKEITIKTQGGDAKQVVIEPSDKVQVRRYAPNSVKFSDASPSTLGDIKAGDTIRVLGTKNEDNTRVQPEEIVYGTFVRQAGTILAIDAAAGTVRMTDLTTKKPVTVKVTPATTLKKILPETAAMMARMQSGGGRPGMGGGSPGAGGPAVPGGNRAPGSASPDGAPAGVSRGMSPGGPGPTGPGSYAQGAPGGRMPGAGGPGGMGGGGRRFDPARILENAPSITLADLKPGDAIMVSSSGGTDPATISAISLVAGVEPLLTAPTKPGQAAGPNTSWNFEMSIPQ